MKIDIYIASQVLILEQLNKPSIYYKVSTSSKGVGQEMGSWQTPLGKHIIRAKIGEGQPLNAVFIGRRVTGEVYNVKQSIQKDWILTRIMWLSGLEVGFNRLGKVDTMRRYIYIHGTPDSEPMGIPNSKGCIRMRNEELIDLFNRVPVGTQLTIHRE